MASRQLKQCLMPGKMDVVGRTWVKALEPGLQKLPAACSVASLEEHMGTRVGSDSIGRAQRQGALRQAARLLHVSCFVVREGILAQKCPVVPIGRRDALHQREQRRRSEEHTSELQS